MVKDSKAKAGPSKKVKIEEPTMAYDPEQDPEKRRGIRRQYRDMYGAVEDTGADAERLNETVQKMDELFERVRAPAEATMDSDLLLKMSMQSAKMARAMKSGSGAFDIDDFIGRLVTFMGGRGTGEIVDRSTEDGSYDDDEGDGMPLKWERIGWKAIAKSRRVPVIDYMNGPLAVEQKIRVVTKRSKLEKHQEDRKKPQEITEDEITRSENETTNNVTKIEKILETTGKINLFKFIVNPNDFAQTVENLFYLSFLIRDGKCFLDFEDGEPVIMLCEQPSTDDYAQGLKKHQLVMELDMTTWKRAIEVFNITKSVIPQRPKDKTRIGGQWYG